MKKNINKIASINQRIYIYDNICTHLCVDTKHIYKENHGSMMTSIIFEYIKKTVLLNIYIYEIGT